MNNIKVNGESLNRKWKIGAEQARHSLTGTWYGLLENFPAALCDPHGYVIFETREDYEKCPQLRHGVHLNVPNGISSIPGYVKKVD